MTEQLPLIITNVTINGKIGFMMLITKCQLLIVMNKLVIMDSFKTTKNNFHMDELRYQYFNVQVSKSHLKVSYCASFIFSSCESRGFTCVRLWYMYPFVVSGYVLGEKYQPR